MIASVLAACSYGVRPPPSVAPRPGAAGALATVCPATFDSFLATFMASAEAQRAATADMIASTHLVDDPQDEYKPVTTLTSREALEFPVMPLSPEQQSDNLRYVTRDAGGRAMLVEFHKEESDAFDVAYRFEKRGCWKLISIVDDSL